MTTTSLRSGFQAWGSTWRLVRIERGRTGEARTMYVIERDDGHRETRARASVLAAAERSGK